MARIMIDGNVRGLQVQVLMDGVPGCPKHIAGEVHKLIDGLHRIPERAPVDERKALRELAKPNGIVNATAKMPGDEPPAE